MTQTTSHLFDGNVTLRQLEELPKPDYGLSHAEVAHNLKACCYALHGWGEEHPVEAALSTSRDTVLIGMEVSPPGLRKIEPGWKYLLGMIYSLSPHVRSRLYHGVSPPAGLGVPIGEWVMRKSGRNFSRYPLLPQLHDGLGEFIEATKEYPKRLYELQRWRMNPREVMELVKRANVRRVLPWKYSGHLYQTLGDKPEYTFWEVLQAFSRTARLSPAVVNRPPSPTNHMIRVNTFREWIERMGRS